MSFPVRNLCALLPLPRFAGLQPRLVQHVGLLASLWLPRDAASLVGFFQDSVELLQVCERGIRRGRGKNTSIVSSFVRSYIYSWRTLLCSLPETCGYDLLCVFEMSPLPRAVFFPRARSNLCTCILRASSCVAGAVMTAVPLFVSSQTGPLFLISSCDDPAYCVVSRVATLVKSVTAAIQHARPPGPPLLTPFLCPCLARYFLARPSLCMPAPPRIWNG